MRIPTFKTLFIVFAWGTVACYLISCQAEKSEKARSLSDAPSTQSHDHGQHQHGGLEITSFGADIAIPDVSFTIEQDSKSGWNLHILTTNFTFTPEKINQDAVAGEGHAHIYVDGYKLARIYGHWYHLKKLTPGSHKVRISLNANDHSAWTHNGEAIVATQSIVAP